MNYALALSLRMEEILLEFQADPSKVPLAILAEEEAAKVLENGGATEGKSVPPPNPFAAFGEQVVLGGSFTVLSLIVLLRT